MQNSVSGAYHISCIIPSAGILGEGVWPYVAVRDIGDKKYNTFYDIHAGISPHEHRICFFGKADGNTCRDCINGWSGKCDIRIFPVS